METMFQKMNRLRLAGRVTLRLDPTSPIYRYNGNSFPLVAIEKPGPRCCVIFQFTGSKVRVRLDEVV